MSKSLKRREKAAAKQAAIQSKAPNNRPKLNADIEIKCKRAKLFTHSLGDIPEGNIDPEPVGRARKTDWAKFFYIWCS